MSVISMLVLSLSLCIMPSCMQVADYIARKLKNRGYALPHTFRNTSVDLRMTSAILSGKNMAIFHRSANYQGSIATRKAAVAKAN